MTKHLAESARMTADDVHEALRRRYLDPRHGSRYVYAREVRLGVGFPYAWNGAPNDIGQYIDAVVVDTQQSNWDVIGFEIKVARSDWLRELKAPEKRAGALKRCSAFYFVTCEGVVKSKSEVPQDCGWMLVTQAGGKPRVRVRASNSAFDLDTHFVMSLLRSVFRESPVIRER